MKRPRPRLPKVGTDPRAVRQRVETLERILERAVVIPGLNRPVGFDVILDVVPVVGNVAAAALSSYMLWEARNLNMPKRHMARMAGNVGIDFTLGLIPWVGAIPDLFFRSNSRNLKIIRKHLDKHHPETGIIDVEASSAEPETPSAVPARREPDQPA